MGAMVFLLAAWLTSTEPAVTAVRANGQVQADVNPTRYHPMHLLDNDPDAVWCTPIDSNTSHFVTIQLKETIAFNRITLHPSMLGSLRIDRVKLAHLRGPESYRIPLGDKPVTIRLPETLQTNQIHLIVDVTSTNPNKSIFQQPVACLGKLQLFHQETQIPLEAIPIATEQEVLLGQWQKSPLGASQISLNFANNGTWQLRFEPFSGQGKLLAKGEYRLKDGMLFMRIQRQGPWHNMHMQLEQIVIDPLDIGAPRGNYRSLQLSGQLHQELSGSFFDAIF